MEKYSDFLERISYQQAQLQIGEGDFTPDGRVYGKVNADNTFRAFYGDTVVFELDCDTKKEIAKMTDRLYEKVPECFCERLPEDTFHMTLHDLSASDNLSEVACEVFDDEVRLLQLLKEMPVKSQTIEMKMNYAVNMVNTSLILALVPVNEHEWNKLQKLYTFIDQIKVCPYPFLTPHITLAYYSHKGFSKSSADKFREVVSELNTKSLKITLHTDKLFYQKFVSMKDYFSVFSMTSIQ